MFVGVNAGQIILRLLFASATWLVVVSGHLSFLDAKSGDANLVFLSVLLIALSPSVVYVICVRTTGKAVVYGFLLVTTNWAAWHLVRIGTGEADLFFPFLAFCITLGVSLSATPENDSRARPTGT